MMASQKNASYCVALHYLVTAAYLVRLVPRNLRALYLTIFA
jgi:hypothetical protein